MESGSRSVVVNGADLTRYIQRKNCSKDRRHTNHEEEDPILRNEWSYRLAKDPLRRLLPRHDPPWSKALLVSLKLVSWHSIACSPSIFMPICVVQRCRGLHQDIGASFVAFRAPFG
jgi:hypothetical protein